jgi:Methane oxygenase PmoA
MTTTKKFPTAIVFAVPALALCGFGLAYQARPGSAYTLTPSPFGMQLKTPDGRVVLEYLTKKPDNSNLTSPSAACFHPVNTPTGEAVTALAPNDHPHHRGIFFGWHDSEFRSPVNLDNYGPHKPIRALNITKADFWAWGAFATREGRVIQNRDLKLTKGDAEHAEIEIHNDWTVNNRKMVDEVNVASVSEREGVYVLDLEYRITPSSDYVLNRASFGGFDVQGRKDGESYFANAAGKVELPDAHYSLPDLNWPPAPWYDFSIKLKGNGKTVGFAVMDHPQNPATTWHNSSHLWMLNPTITSAGPFTIPKGHTLQLRYRVVVHDGDTPTALLEKLSAEWQKR